MSSLSPAQRMTLAALVDSAVPVLPVPADGDPAYWSTAGSEIGVVEALEAVLADGTAEEQSALAQLLDALGGFGFPHQKRAAREAMLATLQALGPEARSAVDGLRGAACMLAHSLVDEKGRNPFWAQYGYPGPTVPPPDEDPGITPYVPADGEVLDADAVVIGSGAGGGVIAGVLAAQGYRVVVLEAGGLVSPRDYRQLEMMSRTMLYRSGMAATAEGNVALLAGATLGGGTTVNWQNCYAPSAAVREQWAGDFGITDMTTPEFDRHMDAVLGRVKGTAQCSDLNGPHQRMADGAEALGWSTHHVVRNVDADRYDPALAGYCQFGDPSMSKMSTLVTYLQDAYDCGARVLVHTRGQHALRDSNGRACGVEAIYVDPETQEVRHLRVTAPTVVVACGALETPALLLRSGFGGPAVGQNLYLHPALGLFGLYEQDQQAWWGPPQALVMDEFRDLGDGYGLLVEGTQYFPGVSALVLAGRDGRRAKQLMASFGRMSNLIAISRDHCGGRVALDERGEAVHSYEITDPRDEAQIRRGYRVLAELHLAAGAVELHMGGSIPVYRRGEDLAAWLAELDALPLGAGGIGLGSAHQMGTARMGTDPTTSACAPTGELHDVPGVWIGDTSAFPTPSGANPMLTCMALAHRTAELILERQEVTSQ